MVAFTIVAGIAWFLHPLSANAQEVTTVAGGSFSGFLDGTGTAARFKDPYGVAVQGDNLFVADFYNNSIRKMILSTQEVTTLAGDGENAIGFADGTGTAARIALVDYGIRTIIDLRQTNETRAEPNFFAHSAEVAYYHLNMIGDEPLGIEPAPGEADRPQQIAHG